MECYHSPLMCVSNKNLYRIDRQKKKHFIKVHSKLPKNGRKGQKIFNHAFFNVAELKILKEKKLLQLKKILDKKFSK